jgi:hypothetical protein
MPELSTCLCHRAILEVSFQVVSLRIPASVFYRGTLLTKKVNHVVKGESYAAFDLPWAPWADLGSLPLTERRRRLLEGILP